MPKLEFYMPLPLTAQTALVVGILSLIDDSGTPVLTVRASSGLPGHQYLANYWEIGEAPIPPGHYKLNLNWLEPYPDQKTAMGSRFYRIIPDPIVEGNYKRVGCGVHYDANYTYSPGSAGCIVALPKEDEPFGWDKMKEKLDAIKLQAILLDVTYIKHTSIITDPIKVDGDKETFKVFFNNSKLSVVKDGITTYPKYFEMVVKF